MTAAEESRIVCENQKNVRAFKTNSDWNTKIVFRLKFSHKICRLVCNKIIEKCILLEEMDMKGAYKIHYKYSTVTSYLMLKLIIHRGCVLLRTTSFLIGWGA